MRALSLTRWVVVVLLAAALIVPALLVSLGGRTIVEVTGSSMAPTLHVGDVVVIRPLDPADLRPGDIVTVEDGSGGYVTHRVLEVAASGKVTLKGDANLFADTASHDVSQVLGVLDAVMPPPFGIALIQLQQWPLRISVLVTILGLAFLPLADDRGARSAPRIEPSVDNPSLDFDEGADILLLGSIR